MAQNSSRGICFPVKPFYGIHSFPIPSVSANRVLPYENLGYDVFLLEDRTPEATWLHIFSLITSVNCYTLSDFVVFTSAFHAEPRSIDLALAMLCKVSCEPAFVAFKEPIYYVSDSSVYQVKADLALVAICFPCNFI